MEDWKKSIVGDLADNMECCDCPLHIEAGNECAGGNYEQCENVWKEFLFNEVDDDEEKETEETKNEVTDEEKKNFMDFLSDCIMHDIMYGTLSKPPFKNITVKMGDMTVTGKPREIAEFLRQAGEMLAP